MHTNLPDKLRSSAHLYNSTSEGSRNLSRTLIKRAGASILAGGSVWLILGIVLRLTGLRDRIDGLSVIYYTTPWPVLATGFFVLGLQARLKQQKRSFIVLILLATAAGMLWLKTSWNFASPINEKPNLRVIFWNVRNNEEDFDKIAARIREFGPDIVALAEAGDHLSNIERWRAAFPEYVMERLPQQMLTMSRTGLKSQKQGDLFPGSSFGAHITELHGRPITILQADLDARPFRSRRPALEALTTRVRDLAGTPLILLGDFNTPRQSAHLDSIRGTLKHAFETRGTGLSDTWPIPFPVLSLDQVWVSPEFEVVSCRQGWSLMSDHRPVFVELRFK